MGQEGNITYSTGSKLTIKIINRLNKIGKAHVNGTRIILLGKHSNEYALFERKKVQAIQRACSGWTGYRSMKSDYRSTRDFLKGIIGDHINLLMTASYYLIVSSANKNSYYQNLLVKISINECDFFIKQWKFQIQSPKNNDWVFFSGATKYAISEENFRAWVGRYRSYDVEIVSTFEA